MPSLLIPNESCLPPPNPAHDHGAPATLAVLDGGLPVVWIRARALGFGGFPDAHVAADAAWIAHAAVSRWIGRRHDGASTSARRPRLRLSDAAGDGERWVLADTQPIARLVDPQSVRIARDAASVTSASRAATSEGAAGHVGFEIAVPLPVSDVEVRAVAYSVYRALCRAGVPWRLWNTAPRARGIRAATSARGSRVVAPNDAIGPSVNALEQHDLSARDADRTPTTTPSLDLLHRDDGTSVLIRDGRAIGWIRRRTICFHGYPTAAEARAVASSAFAALTAWSARQLRTFAPRVDPVRLSIRRDGDVDWLALGDVRIGRLRRTAGRADEGPPFGFELALPARIPASLAPSAARAVDRALQASVPRRRESPPPPRSPRATAPAEPRA
jgi:hypothetical protein